VVRENLEHRQTADPAEQEGRDWLSGYRKKGGEVGWGKGRPSFAGRGRGRWRRYQMASRSVMMIHTGRCC
jgi:hypothetical protein